MEGGNINQSKRNNFRLGIDNPLHWRKFGSMALCIGYTCAILKRLVVLSLSYYAVAQVGQAKATPHTCAMEHSLYLNEHGDTCQHKFTNLMSHYHVR